MRGKGVAFLCNEVISRITPAYAGKRIELYAEILIDEDHPRLCGEKISRIISDMLMSGSPPPMRGKARTLTEIAGTSRITPAYAGKRHISRPSW